MKRMFSFLGFGIFLFALTGCTTTGLSLREKGSFNYSNFIYGLYGKEKAVPSGVKKVVKPIKLAVAQVGENTPPQAVLDKLQKESGMISQVMALPLGGNDYPDYYQNNNNNAKVEDFEKKMEKVQLLAQDLGADYIFLFGGSTDYGYTPSFWQIFDITIIGAYIIPSTKHEVEGRVSGALIDAKDGRVVFVTEAQSNLIKYTPSYMNYYDGNNQILKQIRDDLVKKLTEEFVRKLAEVK